MILFLLLGAGPAATPGQGHPLFRARDLRAGEEVIELVCGGADKDYILEVNGGGLVVADFDLDGHLDLVTVNGSTIDRVRAGKEALPSVLWLGNGSGEFRRGGPEWKLAGGVWGMGGTAGDIDADGDPDLVITEWGRNRVFLNEGGKGFRAVEASGLTGDHWSTSCALLDHDADGKLDLVVINYLEFDLETAAGPGGACRWKGHDVMCGPEGLTPTHDQLFRGNGDGTFVDVSVKSGFRPEKACFGLGVMTLDYDRDGDTDLYVSNDSMPNHLWENQGDGRFVEVGWRRGVSHDSNGREQAGMGIGCADVDGDGRSDLFVTNFSGESNALYRSSRKTGFREKADVARLGGPSIQRLGWGTGMWDYDLDGFIDVSVINGHVYPAADLVGTDTSYAQADQLFLGGPEQRFAERALSSATAGVGRASVSADFDGDGDLDLVVVQMGGPVRFLENRADGIEGRHWFSLTLSATASHPDAIGAHVRVQVGDASYTGEVRTTAGYQAGCSTRLHFGLGAAETLDEVRIEWPSGRVQVLEDVAVNQHLRVTEETE
ncbi:CRTAC1 family protein [Saltatorellus ferox]